MPVFKDSNNIPPLLPEGDYIFCCLDFESKISQGNKTRGSDTFELTLEIEPSGKKVPCTLIDHPTCDWKIDCFLKAAGVALKKGESFDFRQDVANAAGLVYVDARGLRGWCHLTQKTLPPKPDKPALTVNEIQIFYTDKPKLPRREMAQEPDETTPF